MALFPMRAPAVTSGDYSSATLTGPAETLELTAADAELLVNALGYELAHVEYLLERLPGDERGELGRYADHLNVLRDAIGSVVLDPAEDPDDADACDHGRAAHTDAGCIHCPCRVTYGGRL